MKRIFYCIIAFFTLFCFFAGCKKMDSTYRKYIVPGGIIYPGKALSPMVYPGKNRVKISWLRGADPSVTKGRIYWNNYTDSIDVSIPATGDTISVIIDNLAEKTYSFIIKTYDAKGNSSVPVEVLGETFGATYLASLLNRTIISSILDSMGNATIQWGSVFDGAIATEVIYTDSNNVIKDQIFGIGQTNSILNNYKAGTTYKYRTIYLPDSSSIDTFYTQYSDPLKVSEKINKSNWIATADSETPTALLPSGPASKAIDDDITTFWNSVYPSNVNYPHWLEIDMQQVQNISIVELIYRQNVFNSFKDFLIEGSLDGTNWTTYGTFNFATINDPQHFILTGSPKMRYIRLYAINGYNKYASLAEFSVYGY